VAIGDEALPPSQTDSRDGDAYEDGGRPDRLRLVDGCVDTDHFGIVSIAVGVVSVIVAGVALWVAILANHQAKAANTTAQAALDLSREIAEKESRERQQDRDHVLREKRNRIAAETLKAFDEWMLARPLPLDHDEAFSRMLHVVATVRNACTREGLPRSTDQPIVQWLHGAVDEVTENIYRETEIGAPIGKRSWRHRGWRVLEAALNRQLNRWQQTGEFDPQTTVAEWMPRIYFPEEDQEELEKLRESLAADPANGG
jgi:hypothetical protein